MKAIWTKGAAVCGLLLWASVAMAARSEFTNLTSTALLGGSEEVLIMLPDAYDTGTNDYPVVYMLHAWGGNYLSFRSLASNYVDQYKVIAVMPDGRQDSWYIDAVLTSNNNYETFIYEDVVGYVDANYRTIASREGRGILGRSMGGYGAISQGLRHKDIYSAVGSINGALDIRDVDVQGLGLPAILGTLASYPERYEALACINNITNVNDGDLLIYVSAGATDYQFRDDSREFHAELTAQDITHAYREHPGDHSHDTENSFVWIMDGFKEYFYPAAQLVDLGMDALLGFGHRVKLTFTNDAAVGTLTNFPVLVRLSPALIDGFDYGDFTTTDGTDLRFTDAAVSTLYDYEIDVWNTNGESAAWVEVPSLTADGSQSMWCYWGTSGGRNPTASSDPGAAWESNFRGVWHLNADLTDSTPNGNNGVNNDTTAASGQVGNARAFDGVTGHNIDCGAGDSLQEGSTITVSFWVQTATTQQLASIVAQALPNWNPTAPYLDTKFTVVQHGQGLVFPYSDRNGDWYNYSDPESNLTPYFDAADVGAWVHVTVSYGSRIYFYKNGTRVLNTWRGFNPLKVDSCKFWIGQFPDSGTWWNTGVFPKLGGPRNNTFNGLVDEVRFEGTVRSDAWIRATYLNQKANSSFIQYGRARGLLVPGAVLYVR